MLQEYWKLFFSYRDVCIFKVLFLPSKCHKVALGTGFYTVLLLICNSQGSWLQLKGMAVSKGHFFQRMLFTLPFLPWHVLCLPLRITLLGLRGASCFNKYPNLSPVLFKPIKSESKYPIGAQTLLSCATGAEVALVALGQSGNPVTATISCFPQLSQVQGHRNRELLLVYLFPAARRISVMDAAGTKAIVHICGHKPQKTVIQCQNMRMFI